MRFDRGISVIVRETLADNECVSATISASVLQSTPGDPHFPLLVEEEDGGRWGCLIRLFVVEYETCPSAKWQPDESLPDNG